jgi:hypothetical protein
MSSSSKSATNTTSNNYDQRQIFDASGSGQLLEGGSSNYQQSLSNSGNTSTTLSTSNSTSNSGNTSTTLVVAAAPVVVPPPAPVQDAVNGGNVTGLEIGQSGRKVGEYRQVGPKAWVETTQAGEVRFRFDEVQRDDGSVYLLDKARGVQLQLDLHQRKVLYSQDGTARGALYEIMSANAMAVLPLTAPVPVVVAPKDLAQQCREAVQGKVAWNRQGSTSWAAGNLERLCQGTKDPAATICMTSSSSEQAMSWRTKTGGPQGFLDRV